MEFHNAKNYALQNVNLKINNGEHFAVVGKNDSGKTIFIKLMCRLYDVTDGEILINGKSARAFASQGQQRSCVLALKLAEAALLKQMTGIQPVALLDDVMSELDEKRQDYILNNIDERQVFLTCCDPSQVMRMCKGKSFHIKNGAVFEDK